MKRAKREAPLFGVCINNAEYRASLELHKIYRVVPDEDAAQDGDIRVIDESGEGYLYPSDWFALVKLHKRVGWGEERTPTLRRARYVGVPSSPQPTEHEPQHFAAVDVTLGRRILA